MLGFAAISHNFVSVVLTDKWLPNVPYIRIFCIVIIFDIIHVGNCETIKAMGRSDVFLKMEIIKKTSYFIIIAIFVALSKTPLEIACSAIICNIVAIILNCIPNGSLTGYSFVEQLKDILPNLTISCLMAVSIYLIEVL